MAGVIVIEPGTFVIFNLFVTSLPSAFLITNVSHVASIAVVTSVAVALDVAFSKEYPVGRALTVTSVPWANPSYVYEECFVVTTISFSFSVTVNVPTVSLIW